MSVLSFKTFCIEQYADYKKKNSNEIYELFKKKKLLALLDDDYEDLHGMGIEWLLNFFDKYLETNEGHGLVRSILVPDIVKYIQEEFSVDENTALDMFYTSNIGAAFSDDETGLYGQGALYIANLFIQEKKNNI